MLLALLTVSVLHAADPAPAGDRLPPYTRKPAAMKLTAEDLTELEQDKPVVRSSTGDGGGTGAAVQYVRAPADTVWDVILNYDMYPERVKAVVSADIYRQEGDVLFIDMKSKILGMTNVIYSRNVVRRSEGWMAWTLDYSKESAVQDLIGYWRVEQLRAEPPLTRLDHSTTMQVSGVPTFVVNYLTKQALLEGTGWVKQVSEDMNPAE